MSAGADMLFKDSITSLRLARDVVCYKQKNSINETMVTYIYSVSGIATPGPTWACALVNFTCALVNHWL